MDREELIKLTEITILDARKAIRNAKVEIKVLIEAPTNANTAQST